MFQVFDTVIRAFIEAFMVTKLISTFLVPIQKNRRWGIVYFCTTYFLHIIFWSYSGLIESIPLKCFEYYLFYAIAWLIVDYFFENDGFVNFIFVFATSFVYKAGMFGFIFLTTGIYGQFNVSKLNMLREKTSPKAYVVYIVSIFVGYWVARLMIRIYKHFRGYIGFLIIAVCAGTQMLVEIVDRAENVFVLFPDILLFMTLSVVMQNRKLKNEDKQRQHYEQLEKQLKVQQDNLAKIRHDLANHISVADSLQLRDTLHEIEKEIRSGSPIVDCLIEEKERQCIRENIEFTGTYVDLSDNCVSNYDWVSLFANLLDNAFEACMKLQGKRKIALSMERKGDYFLLMVSNSKAADYKPAQEHFITTKGDVANHGYGTQIIRDIVRKYDGRVRYEDLEGEMRVHIILQAFRSK